MNEILKIMNDIGFKDSEVKIYLSLLRLGPSTTGKIINDSGLQSSTIYHTIGSLIQKGLVSYTIKGKIKYYQAVSPKYLSEYVNNRKTMFDQIIPTIISLEKERLEKQNLELYESTKGIFSAFMILLNELKRGEEYLFISIGDEDLKNKNVQLFFKNFHSKRIKKKIKVRGIFPENYKGIYSEYYKDIKDYNVRFYKGPLPSGITLFKDNILILKWQENPFLIFIKSKYLSKQYKSYFDNLWELSH